MPLIAVKAVRAGACPPHPAAGPLPPDGGNWPDDQFTLRLIRDGAIEPVKPVEPAPAPVAPAIPEAAPAPAETKES